LFLSDKSDSLIALDGSLNAFKHEIAINMAFIVVNHSENESRTQGEENPTSQIYSITERL